MPEPKPSFICRSVFLPVARAVGGGALLLATAGCASEVPSAFEDGGNATDPRPEATQPAPSTEPGRADLGDDEDTPSNGAAGGANGPVDDDDTDGQSAGAASDADMAEPVGDPGEAPPCHGPAPGHVDLQRLTVPQLAYTLEDLLGFAIEVPASIPRDDRLGGYITLPDAQLVSQALIEQHLAWTLALTSQAVAIASPAVMICELELDGCADELTIEFMRRAFRRAPSEAEVAHFLAFRESVAGELTVKLEVTLAAILNAPQFLFRERQTQIPGQPSLLTDHDIATRLSYFLWDTMPDEILFAAAAAGELSDPEQIEAQVRRMVASPRIERLARSMAHQWLELGRLWDHELSRDAFPEYDDELKGAMIEETVFFLVSLMREERPLSELLTARESYVNERLAQLYGLEGAHSEAFELTDTSAAGPRLGLLGHAGPMALTSSGDHTSIIRRGKWVSTALMCTEIPPPPPDLETEFPEDLPEDLTPREVVEIHRADPSCAVCHKYLDPPGLLLETYDPLGRIRTHYPEPIDQEINTATVLADGREVSDITGFVSLLTEGEAFARCLADRVFPIAVGRLLGSGESALVDSIARGELATDMTFSELLVNIATSDGFRCDAGEEAP